MLLIEYHEKWVEDFLQIKKILVEANEGVSLQIEHIGSTSIPGMIAKPIIDIDLVYYSKGDFTSIKSNLESIGYYHNGDQGIPGREVFKRVSAGKHKILDTITHHLYVCHAESEELKKHLHFRNTLRQNKSLAQEYEGLKLRLAEKANQDRKLYAQLKETEGAEFFNQY